MNRPHFTTGLALPMHQPWASLAAAGVKTIETRPRASHVRGRIGIFACRFVPPYVYDLLDSKEGRVLVHLCQRHLPGFDPSVRSLGLPNSRVIATVDQYGSVPIVAERPGFAACIKLRARVRAATLRKLQRWNLRPVRCAVCGKPPFGRQALECHHPSFEGRWASWVIVPVHPRCNRLIHDGLVACPAPIDLREPIPAGWFTERTSA